MSFPIAKITGRAKIPAVSLRTPRCWTAPRASAAAGWPWPCCWAAASPRLGPVNATGLVRVVQRHQFCFLFFWVGGGCPTQHGLLPKKGSLFSSSSGTTEGWGAFWGKWQGSAFWVGLWRVFDGFHIFLHHAKRKAQLNLAQKVTSEITDLSWAFGV